MASVIKVVKAFYMFPGFHKEKNHLTQTHNAISPVKGFFFLQTSLNNLI